MTCYLKRSMKRSKSVHLAWQPASSSTILTSKDIMKANELLLHVITILGVTKGGAITCIIRFIAVLGVM